MNTDPNIKEESKLAAQNQELNSWNFDTGIEPDVEEEELTDPFDPEDISIDSKTVAMETCLRRLTQGTIKLNPDFQRNEVWTIEKRSQLIESIMLKIPLPMFYVSADEKGNYTVVDGLQRLSTIRSFILGDEYLSKKDENLKGHGFKLKNLEFWKKFNDKDFKDLPINIQNRILETEFSFTVINPGTPEEVKRNIFKRINTGGMPLSTQEIRNALYIGQSTILLNELAEMEIFKEATGYSLRSIRMADRELVLRFISFLVRSYTSYKKTIGVDSLLSETMIIVNAIPNFDTRDFKKILDQQKGGTFAEDISIKDLGLIKQHFISAMKRAFALFGKHTFRKSYGENRRRPINRSLFETWGVLLSKQSEEEFQHLLTNKTALLEDYVPIIENPEFRLAISTDSLKHLSVQYRFETIQHLINKYNKAIIAE